MVSATGAAGYSSNHPLMKSSMLSGDHHCGITTGAAGDSSNHPLVKSSMLSGEHHMFNVTNIIIFFFIHTLTHYVITRFQRVFLLYAVAILSLVLVRET